MPTCSPRPSPAAELRTLARDVRRIGTGWRDDPETIVLAKHDVADRLIRLADELERR